MKTTIYGPDEGHWLSWFGQPVRYVATGEETGNRYCLSIGTAPPGGGAPPHRHDFDEGFYLLEGTVEFTCGRDSVTLSEGDFITIRGGSAHFPKNVGETPARLLVITTPAEFYEFQRLGGEAREGKFEAEDDYDIAAQQQRMADIADRFAIDLDPPDDAFHVPGRFHVTRIDEGTTIDAVGDRYRFLCESQHTGGQYALWHGLVAPGGGPPPHSHAREFEAFYVLSGEVEFHSDGQTVTGGAGTFVNLPIGSVHRFQNVGTEPAEMLILVAPAGLETFFQKTGTTVTDLGTAVAAPDPSPEKIELLHRIGGEYGITFVSPDGH